MSLLVLVFGFGFLRAALRAGTALLLVFSLAYSVQAYVAQPPACGCAGILMDFQEFRLSAPSHLALLGLLILAMSFGQFSYRSVSEVPVIPHARREAGYTLIETLLVLVIVSLLAALTIPRIAAVRKLADRAVSLSNLRSHAAMFTQYDSDYKDTMPCFIDPLATKGVIRGGNLILTCAYFDQTLYWNIPMSDLYYQLSPRAGVFARPRRQVDYATDYWYSSSFLADPSFWVPETRTGPSQWGPVRLSDVRFPSRKAMFFTGFAYWDEDHNDRRRNPTAEIALSDGSALAVKSSSLTAPYYQGEGNWPGSRFPYGIAAMHTPEGVRGRDIP